MPGILSTMSDKQELPSSSQIAAGAPDSSKKRAASILPKKFFHFNDIYYHEL